jgi:hypothetical protein
LRWPIGAPRGLKSLLAALVDDHPGEAADPGDLDFAQWVVIANL